MSEPSAHRFVWTATVLLLLCGVLPLVVVAAVGNAGLWREPAPRFAQFVTPPASLTIEEVAYVRPARQPRAAPAPSVAAAPAVAPTRPAPPAPRTVDPAPAVVPAPPPLDPIVVAVAAHERIANPAPARVSFGGGPEQPALLLASALEHGGGHSLPVPRLRPPQVSLYPTPPIPSARPLQMARTVVAREEALPARFTWAAPKRASTFAETSFAYSCTNEACR